MIRTEPTHASWFVYILAIQIRICALFRVVTLEYSHWNGSVNGGSVNAGVSFIPLVVESLGGWSDEAAHNITRIGRLLGQRSGSPPAETTSHLFQRLSISLWRGNARECYPMAVKIAYCVSMDRWEHLTPPPPPLNFIIIITKCKVGLASPSLAGLDGSYKRKLKSDWLMSCGAQ